MAAWYRAGRVGRRSLSTLAFSLEAPEWDFDEKVLVGVNPSFPSCVVGLNGTCVAGVCRPLRLVGDLED